MKRQCEHYAYLFVSGRRQPSNKTQLTSLTCTPAETILNTAEVTGTGCITEHYAAMPPKNKMTTKVCPDCDTPCAVACKTCTCGYSFYHSRRSDSASASTSADQGEDGGVRQQRRTQRIKEKPNYYDATEFMKEKRKRRRRNDDQYELRRGSEPAATGSGALKRRKKRKGGRGAPKEEEEEEEVVLPIGISPAKEAQCAVILADLNRRIFSTAVRVR